MSNKHSTFPEIPVSHDATTYMDHLPLHKKNQHQLHHSLTRHGSDGVSVLLQYLCSSSDEHSNQASSDDVLVWLQYLCSSSDEHSNQASSDDELLGLIVDNNNSADEAMVITFADDVIIIDDEVKKKKQKRKRQSISWMKDEFYAFHLKKKKRSLLTINTKFWTRRGGPY